MAETKSPQTNTSEDTKTIVTILLLIFIFPVGFLLMWFWTKWKLLVKILVSIIPLLLLVPLGLIATITLTAINPQTQIQKAKCMTECVKIQTRDVCEKECLGKTSAPKQALKVNDLKVQKDLDSVGDALVRYFEDNNVFPKTLAEIKPKYVQDLPLNVTYKTINNRDDYVLQTILSTGETYEIKSSN